MDSITVVVIVGGGIASFLWAENRSLRKRLHALEGECAGLRGWLVVVAKVAGIELEEYRQ